MRREEHVADGPRWRAILEARWRDRLQEVTELSLAYHVAVGDAPESRYCPGCTGSALRTDARERVH